MPKKKPLEFTENMTDEEVDAFNAEQAAKKKALVSKQAVNRERAKANKPRDESVTRGIKGKDQIECECLKRVGLDNNETSDIGEVISIPKEIASRLQDAQAIKVKL